MDKLLIAFVQAADADRVADALRDARVRFTRIPSFGGFLAEPNATFVLAIPDAELDTVVDVFEASTQQRETEVPLVLLERLDEWRERTVQLGGATILVADLSAVIRT